MSLAQSLLPELEHAADDGARRSCVGLRWLVALVALTLPAPPAVAAGAEKPSPEARLAEAAELFSTGRYAECEQHFAAVGRSDVRLGLAARAFYGAACCAAQRGDPDGAFGQFANALAVGFRDLERALADPRLEPLRTDPRWLQFLKRTETQQQKHLQTLDKELLAHYVEDREQRLKVSAGADAASFAAASAVRRAKVVNLVEQGRAKQADDCFHAGAVLAGSTAPEELARAEELARRALAIDPDLLAARPLVATAVDRRAMVAGKPQKYGTQIVELDGRWQLHPVDPATTDAERAAMGLPPLSDARARAAALNPEPAPPPAGKPPR